MLSPGRGRRSRPLIWPEAGPVLGGPGAVTQIKALIEVERLVGSLGLQEQGAPTLTYMRPNAGDKCGCDQATDAEQEGAAGNHDRSSGSRRIVREGRSDLLLLL